MEPNPVSLICLHSLRTAEFVWWCHWVSSARERERHPNRCQKKEAQTADEKPLLACTIICARPASPLVMSVDFRDHSECGGDGQCLAGSLVAPSKRNWANICFSRCLPPPNATPLRSKHVVWYISGQRRGAARPGSGLLLLLLFTWWGSVSGPGKRDKEARRNFLLTREIGTCCAAKQPNRPFFFVSAQRNRHMLVTQALFFDHCRTVSLFPPPNRRDKQLYPHLQQVTFGLFLGFSVCAVLVRSLLSLFRLLVLSWISFVTSAEPVCTEHTCLNLINSLFLNSVFTSFSFVIRS